MGVIQLTFYFLFHECNYKCNYMCTLRFFPMYVYIYITWTVFHNFVNQLHQLKKAFATLESYIYINNIHPWLSLLLNICEMEWALIISLLKVWLSDPWKVNQFLGKLEQTQRNIKEYKAILVYIKYSITSMNGREFNHF